MRQEAAQRHQGAAVEEADAAAAVALCGDDVGQAVADEVGAADADGAALEVGQLEGGQEAAVAAAEDANGGAAALGAGEDVVAAVAVDVGQGDVDAVALFIGVDLNHLGLGRPVGLEVPGVRFEGVAGPPVIPGAAEGCREGAVLEHYHGRGGAEAGGQKFVAGPGGHGAILAPGESRPRSRTK
jgi:hypothetical protein